MGAVAAIFLIALFVNAGVGEAAGSDPVGDFYETACIRWMDGVWMTDAPSCEVGIEFLK